VARRRRDETDFLSADEADNLSIRAGTLTQKEREIINYHIVATIKMLEQLPWPKHLTKVPEYAGGHHERMDGKGYPKGLTREQMSLQARMMGIADIFEALTAKGPALQAGHEAVAGDGHHGQLQEERPHRPRPVRGIRQAGRVSQLRRSSSSIRGRWMRWTRRRYWGLTESALAAYGAGW
jgi:hypothetical protein